MVISASPCMNGNVPAQTTAVRTAPRRSRKQLRLQWLMSRFRSVMTFIRVKKRFASEPSFLSSISRSLRGVADDRWQNQPQIQTQSNPFFNVGSSFVSRYSSLRRNGSRASWKLSGKILLHQRGIWKSLRSAYARMLLRRMLAQRTMALGKRVWLLMWQYEKTLQYPVNIKNPNPTYAKIIMSQYGGADCKQIYSKNTRLWIHKKAIIRLRKGFFPWTREL